MKSTSVLASLVLFLVGPLLTQVQAGRGADYWRKMRPINSEKDAKALSDDCTMAMVCSMCKNVTISSTKTKTGREGQGMAMPMTLGAESACENCGGTVSVAKGKEAGSMQMNCSKCGQGSAFCCAADNKM